MKVKSIFNNLEYGLAPESSSAANEWLDKHKRKFTLFIDGQWQTSTAAKYFESSNPSNKKLLAKISTANATDVDKAVKAARKALPKWVKLGAHARARYLYAMARQIQKYARLFAVLESMENGKPIRESRDIDIPLAARHFYHHAGWAQLRDTELRDYKEVGVIAQIIPWNFPLLMLAWKIAPALAMGNTVVLKPAEFTSLTALLFAELCQQIGLPNGVVNIITGAGPTGAALVEHKGIDKIAFTGSTEVGRAIRKATAGTGKKISLELGGKSPFIVFDDADLDTVVEGVVDAIWFNQGQVCCAGSRLLVQESVAEKLYKKIKSRMEKLRVGDALDKSIDLGAIIAPIQLRSIEKLVKKGVEEGGHLWQPSWKCPTDGYYYPPTLFTEVAPASSIAQEEIFGPVLVAMTFRTHEEAIKLANNTRYGLAASLWTENINLALEVAPKIKAGTVWINCTNVFDAAAGFGGYRESGFGREGGKEGLYDYMKLKSDEKLTTPKKVVQKKLTSKALPLSVLPEIDRTVKMYIGGKQTRPDSGYSLPIESASGKFITCVGEGSRKDIRNAVEAAHAAQSWTDMSGHARAQILYYLAENLTIRKEEFANRLIQLLGVSASEAMLEVSLSIEHIYTYAAYADKYDGHVHHTISRHVTMAMPEALGVMGIVCANETPLLGFISSVIPALAMGNRVVAIPSELAPLCATDLYQIIETSDFPAGIINIITGRKEELTEVLAKHDDVDGVWYFGTKEGSKIVEMSAAENMKRTWVNYGKPRNWLELNRGEQEQFLRQATQVKNIWIPYGA
ncbi:MAG: aldehyde dehydrogenase family protein [Bacteroidetes bacterium]|nr:aldehyde dehydrogenase family protein [Bacteroidota bacterium]